MWDAADYLADATIDAIWPGYRAGALLRNESGYLAATPYGDAADVLLSDAIPAVLAAYDTIVLAHRATTDAAEVARRLSAFILSGGNVFSTASTLADLQGFSLNGTSLGGIVVEACAPAPAGTTVQVVGGEDIVEPLPFILCALHASSNSTWNVLASINGVPAAVRMQMGNGSLVVVAAGNYGMSTEVSKVMCVLIASLALGLYTLLSSQSASPNNLYGCGVDEPDSRDTQPFQLTSFARYFLEASLSAASTFDLGSSLSWVPKRIAPGSYTLTVTNPTLVQAPLRVTSRLGQVSWVQVLPLDESEKDATGYLPHGFEGVNIGKTTNTTLAGGDTIIIRVELASDSSVSVVNTSAASPPPEWAQRRLVRLQSGSGDLRRSVLSRSAFDASFGGFLVDWGYVLSRTTSALAAEAVWLRSHGIAIAVDFTSGVTLFPGLRLCDDIDVYYQSSLAAIREVLEKMPALGAADAIFTLHGTSEIPPANFSAGTSCRVGHALIVSARFSLHFFVDPTRSTLNSSLLTLQTLSAEAAALNITMHLRRTSRNEDLLSGDLSDQAAFAAAAGLRIAPSFAYTQISGDSAADIVGLLQSGNATMVLLSSAWQSAGGRFSEGGLLADLPDGSVAALRQVHEAAIAAGAWIVLDAGYDSDDQVGRAQELADAAFLVDALSGPALRRRSIA